MLRNFATGAAVIAALVLPVAGCASGDTKGSQTASSPSPSPKPAEALAAAVAKTSTVNFKSVLAGETPGENVAGAYDGTTKIGSFAGQDNGQKMEFVVTANELYLSGPTDLQGKSVRMEVGKFGSKSPLAVFLDPHASQTLLSGVTQVETTSPGSFSGSLDLAKVQAATPGAKKFVEYLTAGAGAKANSVKFIATVDDQGYLTRFKATLPGVDNGKDSEFDLKLSEFGAPVTVAKPDPAKVVEATAEMYNAT